MLMETFKIINMPEFNSPQWQKIKKGKKYKVEVIDNTLSITKYNENVIQESRLDLKEGYLELLGNQLNGKELRFVDSNGNIKRIKSESLIVGMYLINNECFFIESIYSGTRYFGLQSTIYKLNMETFDYSEHIRLDESIFTAITVVDSLYVVTEKSFIQYKLDPIFQCLEKENVLFGRNFFELTSTSIVRMNHTFYIGSVGGIIMINDNKINYLVKDK